MLHCFGADVFERAPDGYGFVAVDFDLPPEGRGVPGGDEVSFVGVWFLDGCGVGLEYIRMD